MDSHVKKKRSVQMAISIRFFFEPSLKDFDSKWTLMSRKLRLEVGGNTIKFWTVHFHYLRPSGFDFVVLDRAVWSLKIAKY